MLNIRDLRIDPASLGEKKLLVEIIPAYEYKDGVKTNNIIAHRYVVALPKHNLEKIGVRIDGEQLMYKLLQKVKDGMTTTEIIEESPSFAFKSRDIDTLREKLLYERYQSENRNVKV